MTAALPALRKVAGPAFAPPGYSSRRPLAFGFLTLAVLACGLLGWGAFTTIAGAVIATGRVDVETRDQVVEHIGGGTVEGIQVRDGDRVAAGDELIRFDDAALRSEEALLRDERVALTARRNRLEAEFLGADAIEWDAGLEALAQSAPVARAALDGERRLFAARHSSWAGQVAQLRERIGQTRKQIAGLEAQAEAVRRQRAFIGRELDAQRSLFEKGLTQLHRLLELEREAARLDGQAGDIAARIAGARGRIAEIEIAVLQIGAGRVEEAEGQAREVQAKENQVRERLAEVRRLLAGMTVRAPVSGEVHGMRVFAPGEVVRPGEPILHIVPEGAGLVVLAQLDPIHVDQVRAGQEAVLRFSAFPARNTPEFEGRIRRVSADTVQDERTGLSWYEVELEMGRAVEPDEEPAGRSLGLIGVRPGRGLAPGPAAAAPGERTGEQRSGRRRKIGGLFGTAGPRAGSGALAGHACRGARSYRGAHPAQLSRQAADRLLPAVAARGVIHFPVRILTESGARVQGKGDFADAGPTLLRLGAQQRMTLHPAWQIERAL